MAYISQYSCGSSYLQLQVKGLNSSNDRIRTYYWYVSMSEEKPGSYFVKNEDDICYQAESPIVTLGGLVAQLVYHVWCDVYLQGELYPIHTLSWSGATQAEHPVAALAVASVQALSVSDDEYETNANTVTITVGIGGGVSSVDVYFNSTSHIVYESDGSKTFYVTAGTSITIRNVVPASGYASPYLLYYNTSANPYTYSGPKSFTGSTTISETSFNRLLSISATESSSTTDTVTVTVGLSTVSSIDVYFDSTSHIVYESEGSKTFYISAGTSVQLRNPVPASGYTSPYYLYYNTAANPYTYSGPSEFTSYITISDTSYNRLLSVSATEEEKVYIYLTVSTGVSQVDIVVDGTLYTVYSTSGQRGFKISPGATVKIQNPKAEDGYNSSFELWYNTEIDPYGENGPDTFYGIIVIDDTTYDRYLKVTATKTIALFSWTNDDAANIVAGKPVSNITATAWANLIAKISSVGGSTSTIPSVSAGTKMTAYQFNQMRNAIAALTGAGTVASAVSAGATILATLFANDTKALKESINRAINNYNS